MVRKVALFPIVLLAGKVAPLAGPHAHPLYFLPLTAYEQLLHLAFTTPNDIRYFLTPNALQAHARLQAAAAAERPFRFEQLRLGVALSLLKLLADLGDHAESRQALDLLHRALNEARSPADIDRIIGRDARLFDQLYENLYVNEQGEEVLNLFGRTLEADAPAVLDAVARDGVNLARTLDFSDDEEE